MPHSNDWKEKLTRRWNTANLMGLQEQIAFIESLLLSQKQEIAERVQMAIYKKEKNDPRWVPVRVRGWKECKATVLDVLSK